MSASQGPSIAIVEDDAEIRDLVVAFLSRENYCVAGFENGAAFDDARETSDFDLVILDIMMPGEDGLSICRRLIAAGGPAVIILSAKGDDIDRIVGLEIGADDYLVKPFNPRELLARIKSVLRRKGAAPVIDDTVETSEVLIFSGWRLAIEEHSLINPQGAAVTLSPGEFSLLAALARHPRRIISRDQLLDWTRGSGAAPVDRAIDVQLSRLRRKLGDDPKSPTLIKTVRGGGYLFASEVKKAGAP